MINGKLIKEIEVLDTANFQTINLGDWYSRIEITILEIYKGTLYEDMY